jgi:sRNA-binding regulator protein Hfq
MVQDFGGGNKRRKGGGAIRAKAERLQQETGLPRAIAFHVAMGKTTLKEALSKMVEEENIDKMVRRHGLDRSLASQVVRGQQDLDEVLQRDRLKAHLVQNIHRSVLDEAAAAASPLWLALHGKGEVQGIVKGLTTYAFMVESDGKQVEVEKIQIKFATFAQDRASLSWGVEPSRDGSVEPISKPQDRVGVSDKRIFSFLDEAKAVVLTTVEGECLQGELVWMGRWELGLKQTDGTRFTVFRHALAAIEAI